jgi:hypothetical protein
VKFRQATVSDIPQIQAIERDFYDGFKLPEEILRGWIDNLGENFLVAEDMRKLVGCIFWEQLEEIKALPYIHKSKDSHKPNGEYFYISEVGVLNKKFKLLQKLFDRVVESARKKNIKAIIWVTGMDEEGHDVAERSLIEKNGFEKFKHAGRWEYSPGKFSEKHWIFMKKL